ncbi:MAG: beta-N-acetylhexosaminidase [Bacteroidales bacterium]|nr:beta-N-acetylhexosaminidase [Bacteroidales bacterium]
MKVSNLIIIALIFTIISCKSSLEKPEDIQIIPQPVDLVQTGEDFVINENLTIYFDESVGDMEKAAIFLQNILGVLNSGSPEFVKEQGESQIQLLFNSELEKEEYYLNVNEERVEIVGGSAQAVFLGIQTLRQLMPIEFESGAKMDKITVRAASIKDKPRFSYRGMHFDVCRHFFTVEEVKQYIDLLVLHKFNTFHWHLTEDQAWRIEIKKHPKLTEIGSYRSETVIGKNTGVYDGTPHSGYFTQEDIKEVVKYAEDRFLLVIPEIEMPGHALAALASYPELGCSGGPYEVAKTWGVFEEVFCAGNEQVFELLEDVIDEVCEMFPNSPYIHIGGDECPKDAWKACAKCQARIAEENLTDENELQSYFVTRMEKYINSKGRKIIGWDEILEGGLAPNATVLSWQGEEGGIAAARMGHDVIMAPTSICYFDYYQTTDTANEPYSIGGHVSVEIVYNWEPVPSVLNEDEAKHILGGQANLWTEYISTISHAQYMVLPRMAALSEVLWTKNKPGFDDFINRLQILMQRYEAAGYNYAKHYQK